MSYPYPSYGGRGGSAPRPPRPHVEPPPYGHSPPPAPPQYGSQPPSPYGRGPGPGRPPPWASQPSYGSQQGSPSYAYPPAPSPYRQNSYPPAPSPHGYLPPPPPQFYGGSPPYGSPQGYQGQPYRRDSYDRDGPPQHYPPNDRRHSGGSSHSRDGRDSSQPRRGRGHYSNLSWTPSTGSRGGVQVPPKSKGGRDDNNTPEDEDDNPFRPSKDLQSEDLSARDARSKDSKNMPPPSGTPPRQDSDNRIKFALKSKMPLNPQKSADELLRDAERLKAELARREPKREKKLVKRMKPKAVLDPDHATSDSVYFRKPGNESVVGSGTYGKVFKAVHVYTRERVALKKIRMEGERDGFPVTAIREVKLLQSLNNDNIVKLQEVMVERNDCYMVFEYLSHDLTGLLNHPTFKLEHAHKKHLAKQLFEGLDYLHRRGVLHRDIKAANILISNTGQLKLADFGLARFFAKRRQLDYTNRVITIWYRSPELLLGETQYGPAVDIWSAACVLVEIFTRHAIFPGDGGEISQLERIYSVLGTPTRTEWPSIVDLAWFELLRPTERKPSTFAEKYKDQVTTEAFALLQDMFRWDPRTRPSAAEVLEHPYFVDEAPPPKRAEELKDLEGDWHEFESKALRKEKERSAREARKNKEAEERRERDKKRAAAADEAADEAREPKRPKFDEDAGLMELEDVE